MFGAVRLYAEQSEGSRDRAFRKAGRCGGGAHRPVRRVGGLAVEDGAQKLRHSLFVVGSRAPGPRLAVQAHKALIEPFLAPVADGRVRNSNRRAMLKFVSPEADPRMIWADEPGCEGPNAIDPTARVLPALRRSATTNDPAAFQCAPRSAPKQANHGDPRRLCKDICGT